MMWARTWTPGAQPKRHFETYIGTDSLSHPTDAEVERVVREQMVRWRTLLDRLGNEWEGKA